MYHNKRKSPGVSISGLNWRLSALILCLTVAFVALLFTHQGFLEWAFARHRNILSWYIRPLLLVPFGLFCYRRNLPGAMLCILLLLTSMFFFPEPKTVDDKVSSFLAYEKQWIQGSWPAGKILSALLVPTSLFALGASLWKRSFRLALVLLGAMAIGKIAWAMVGSSGVARAIAPPALAGLAICAMALLFIKKNRKR